MLGSPDSCVVFFVVWRIRSAPGSSRLAWSAHTCTSSSASTHNESESLVAAAEGGSAAVAGKERHSTEGHRLRWAKGYSISSVSPRSLTAVREYLRSQPTRHSDLTIPGWEGDQPEYESAGADEWRSELRSRM